MPSNRYEYEKISKEYATVSTLMAALMLKNNKLGEECLLPGGLIEKAGECALEWRRHLDSGAIIVRLVKK